MEHPSATSDESHQTAGMSTAVSGTDYPVAHLATDAGRPHAEILIRLLTNPRMQWVWDELSRLDPNTGDYLHPARPPATCAPTQPACSAGRSHGRDPAFRLLLRA